MRKTALLLLCACGPAQEPVTPAPKPIAETKDAALAAPACPDKLDVPALLARHAKAYGSKEQALASHPMTVRGTIDRPGLRGTFEIVRDRKARRLTMWVDGIFRSSGYDQNGSWVQGTHGALVRLAPGETRQHGAWIEQRGYLRDFDPSHDIAACDVMDAEGGVKRALVRVKYKLPEEGDPLVVFDNDTAELVASGMTDVDGSQILWRYEKWSAPDKNGARWPLLQQELTEAGPDAELSIEKTDSGLVCPPIAPNAPVAPDCISPHASRIAWEWPATGPKRARVPMRDDLDIVTFTIKAAGKDVTALYDPSESILGIVDEDGGAKAAFASTKHFKLGTPPEVVEFDVGTADLGLGTLAVKRAPALMRGIGNVDTTGTERPMIISGIGLTAALAVRVDHGKKEIVFAPSGEPLAAKNATIVPIRLNGGEAIVVDAMIDGKNAPLELQFQAALGADIFESWGSAHDVPGSRPTVAIDKNNVVTRIQKIELGPIKYENQLARVGVRSSQHDLAGRLSVSVLLRCNAFVLDVSARTLALEPPCDRPVQEDLAGWTLARDISRPADPPGDRPWRVGALLKDGSADRAGIREGDRILDVGGKPAILDRATFLPLLSKPGAKVEVSLLRGTEKKKVTMTLTKLLP
jgi:hypothetical protein